MNKYSIFGVICTLIGATSCNNNVSKSKIEHKATQSIELGLNSPNDLTFTFSHKLDSAFGLHYFSDAEINVMRKILMENIKTLDSITGNYTQINFNNETILRNIRRQIKANEEFRFIEANGAKGKWSGWKTNISYQYRTQDGQNIVYTTWIFFDKNKESVIGKFELPLISNKSIHLINSLYK